MTSLQPAQAETHHYRNTPNLIHSTQVYFSQPWRDEVPWRVVRVSRERWQPHFSAHKPAGYGTSEGELWIFLVTGGAGRVETGAGDAAVVKEISAGHLLLAGPNDRMVMVNNPKDPLSFEVIIGAGAGIGDLLKELCPGLPVVFRPQRLHDIERIMSLSFETACAGGPVVEDVCGEILRVLLRALANDQWRAQQSPSDSMFYTAKRLIDERFMELRRVEDVAAHMNVSRAWLDRLFRKHLDRTPRDYLEDVRLGYAAHRITTSNTTIAAIAEELQYPDQFAFSRAFRRRYGVAPSRYGMQEQ